VKVVMGRPAGWLTAAAHLARTSTEDGPNLVYVPEVPLAIESLQAAVQAALDRYGRCVIAVSEGVHDAAGELIASSGDVDAHGNMRLSGTGILGDLLAEKVREVVGSDARVRADTFGYLQRSYFGVVSPQDAIEARQVGRHAVQVALEGKQPHGSITIGRGVGAGGYEPVYGCTDLENVAQKTKLMPADFLEGTSGISPAFVEYLKPLVGELPRPGRLSDLPVPKRLG